MYFRNYGLPKAGLDKYLKSDVSQFPSTGNTRNALKHISNRHGGTFTIFIENSKGYSV